MFRRQQKQQRKIYAELSIDGKYKVKIPNIKSLIPKKILKKITKHMFEDTYILDIKLINKALPTAETALKNEVESILIDLARKQEKELYIYRHDITALIYDTKEDTLSVFGKVDYVLKDAKPN